MALVSSPSYLSAGSAAGPPWYWLILGPAASQAMRFNISSGAELLLLLMDSV